MFSVLYRVLLRKVNLEKKNIFKTEARFDTCSQFTLVRVLFKRGQSRKLKNNNIIINLKRKILHIISRFVTHAFSIPNISGLIWT